MSIEIYQTLKNVGLSDQRATQMPVTAKHEVFAVDQVVWPKEESQQPRTYIVSGLVCACVPDTDGGMALFDEAIACSSSHLPHFEAEDNLDIPLKQSILAALRGVSRGIFLRCGKQWAAAGLLRLGYASVGDLAAVPNRGMAA